VPYRYLPALAAVLELSDRAPTAGGWALTGVLVDGNAEAIMRALRDAVFRPQDLTEDEEAILRAAEQAGTDVNSIFDQRGSPPDRDCSQICRGDAAEYLGAALLVREGVDVFVVWGKNFRKLKCTSSEIGMDIMAARIGNEALTPLAEDEKLYLLSAKHSKAARFGSSIDGVVTEFNTLTAGMLAQEIRMFRWELRIRNHPRYGRVLLFVAPIIEDELQATCLELRVTTLVDQHRVAEMAGAITGLDRVRSTTGRRAYIAGLREPLETLHERIETT
jgi:hypothetical protein